MKFLPAPHQFQTGDVLQADDVNRNWDHFRELVDEVVDNSIYRTTISLSASNFAFDDGAGYGSLRWVSPFLCTVEQFRITAIFGAASGGTATSAMTVDGYVNGITIPGLATRITSLTYTDSAVSTNSYQELSRFTLEQDDELEFRFGQLAGADEWVVSQVFIDLNVAQDRWHPDSNDLSVAFEPAIVNGGDPRSASIIGANANLLGDSVDALISWKTLEHLTLHGNGTDNIIYIPESSGNRRLTRILAIVQTASAGTGGDATLRLQDNSGNTLQSFTVTIANGATWGYSETAVATPVNLGGGDFANTSDDVRIYITTTSVGGATVIRGGVTLIFRAS